ncbi:MAG: hypothetical protein ACYDC7_04975 [Acidithiobacillus ferrivorans]
MVEAHAFIFGTPTRFGVMSAQIRSFLDHTDPITEWLHANSLPALQLWTSEVPGRYGGRFMSAPFCHRPNVRPARMAAPNASTVARHRSTAPSIEPA